MATSLLLSNAAWESALAAQEPAPDQTTSQATCAYARTRRLAQVNDAGIREASGLVASQQYPGVYWTLNDSGNGPNLYAFDQDGRPRGTFQVTGAGNQDWEALQRGPDGNGGQALYIGDVGDNDYQRGVLTIYRVPEPEPRSTNGSTEPATAFRFSYPGGPHNTEAFLVHPVTGEIVVITREVGGVSLVYRLPQPLDSSTTMVAELVDVVDVRTFDAASGQVTDATISTDGRHVALRTYARLLVYDVPEGGSWDAIWGQQPRVYPVSDGPKGEGLAFRLDSDDLMSVGEERPTALYETAWHC
ncbi:MAG: hypothetical protein AB7K36_16390 [Chloroflexota bacterium]